MTQKTPPAALSPPKRRVAAAQAVHISADSAEATKVDGDVGAFHH